jgi:hypothetical protein
VEIGGKLLIRSGKSAPSQKIHSYNFNNKSFFISFILPFNNKFVPCCDDERCAFVETATTSVASTDCAGGVMCIACVYLGYFLDRAQLTSSLDFFILKASTKYPQFIQSIFTARSRKIFAAYLAATARYKIISLPVSGLKMPHTSRMGKNVE